MEAVDFEIIHKAFLSTFDGEDVKELSAFNECAAGTLECALIYLRAQPSADRDETLATASSVLQNWLIREKGFLADQEASPDGTACLSMADKRALACQMMSTCSLDDKERDALLFAIASQGRPPAWKPEADDSVASDGRGVTFGGFKDRILRAAKALLGAAVRNAEESVARPVADVDPDGVHLRVLEKMLGLRDDDAFVGFKISKHGAGFTRLARSKTALTALSEEAQLLRSLTDRPATVARPRGL